MLVLCGVVCCQEVCGSGGCSGLGLVVVMVVEVGFVSIWTGRCLCRVCMLVF